MVREIRVGELFDDFSDNKYKDRDARRLRVHCATPINLHIKGKDRPEWTVTGGSWDASAGYLYNAGSSTADQQIQTPSTFVVGTWEYDLLVEKDTSDPLQAHFMWVDANNYMGHDHRGATTDVVRLWKIVAGTATVLISTAMGLVAGVYETHKITRDSSGNYEIFIDGVSKGTATDVAITSSNKFQFSNPKTSTPSACRIDNVKVY
ncbi:MAG: hypothetical protein QMC77_08800 [Methanocellales archaeon]|nr:hypothetical protein [Methanocellales archaeon]